SQAAPAGGRPVHLQRAEDQFDAGADRRHRRRVLRHAHRRHGLPHLDRGRTDECRHGLGGDRGRGGRGLRLLRGRVPRREGRDVLASVCPWWIGATSEGETMKKTAVALLAGAMSLAAFQALAADKVTLQLKWVTQAQFAGYYVAKDKGFYEEENLDVEIKPGGPDIAPPQVIAGGGADVVVDWMPSALATREKGVPLVNIAQPFKKSGMMLTCRKDTNITKPEDFRGRTLGVW